MTDKPTRPPMPRTVWALGFTSLLMDVSSEMIHGLLPIFLVVTLGASASILGLLEGIAEATAQIVKVFSGWLSDRLGKRKRLAVIGYALAAFTKPLFPLANSIVLVFFARFADRIGKGIRGAPRDALVADVTPPEIRGAAYGLRQSLDTVGAAIGPVLAIGLMFTFANDIRSVLWFAVIPAFLAVLVLLIGVKEPPRDPNPAARLPIRRADFAALGPAYRRVVILGAAFTLARFSEAFLVVRANAEGLPLMWTPAVIALLSLVFAVAAYPAGLVQDRAGPRGLLIAGLGVLVVADLALAAGGLPMVLAGIALWGLHMGLTQGVIAALVAETAPGDLRGTAFGVFNLVTGMITLVASVLAGLLWDSIGPAATFLGGAVWAIVAVVMIPSARGKGLNVDHSVTM